MMRTLSATVLSAIGFLSTVAAQSLKSTISSHPSLTILHGLLNQFDLLESFDSLTNITLVAPTDEAYRALANWGFNVSEVEPFIARALLTYHVLDGTYTADSIPGSDEPQVVHSLLQPPVLTNVSRGAAVKLSRDRYSSIVIESGLQVIGGVEQADIHFQNGIIHTLNSSMVLPHNISTTSQIGNLFQFLDALETAEVVTSLEGLKDVTLFIPHDGAFRKLNPLLHLLRPSQLAQVLQYHVIPNHVLYHKSIGKNNSTYETLQGASLRISTDENGVSYVNGARIVRNDLIIYGGVAHIIDEVVIPELDLSSGPQDCTSFSFKSRKTPWTPIVLW